MQAMDSTSSRHHASAQYDGTKDPTGPFAWIMDPDGTKIELWQPTPH
jgi:hypothetical protein